MVIREIGRGCEDVDRVKSIVYTDDCYKIDDGYGYHLFRIRHAHCVRATAYSGTHASPSPYL